MEKTMRIAICDDEKRICAILAEKVGKFCPGAVILTYSSGKSNLRMTKQGIMADGFAAVNAKKHNVVYL